MKIIVYVGIDVHKSTFSACCYTAFNQSFFAEDTFPGTTRDTIDYLETVKNSIEGEVEFHCGYEAGCRGYSLAKDLISKGYDCSIMAPTTIDKPSDTSKKKTDRLDARLLSRALANMTYRKVHIPDDHDLMVKEKLRMYQTHKKHLRQFKQSVCSLLLRFGKVYDSGKGRSYWTKKHLDWIKGMYSDPVFGKTLEEYMDTITKFSDKIERLEKELNEVTTEERYKDIIDRICCLKGIERISALTFVSEIGDFARFQDAKVFPAYLGMVPGDHSSGGKEGKLGITKLGNSVLRRLAIECTQSAVRGIIGSKSRKMKERQEGMELATISYADRGSERMQRRYLHLISEGKARNKAITACAREYVGFIWGLATMRYDG